MTSVDRDNAQLLVNELFQLPAETVEEAVVVPLPKTTTMLPREKPIPPKKVQTRWEQFAAAKGIKKTKKAKLLWDEATQSWKPRYGYRRAENDKARDWMREIPGNKGALAFFSC